MYKNLDFDADYVGLYREVRLWQYYMIKKMNYFGPLIVVTREKESKEAIKNGSKRIQEKVKVKEIRQNFSKATINLFVLV